MFGFDFASSFNAKVSSIVLSEIRIDQGESEQAEFERLRDFFKLSPSLQATDVYRLFMEDPVVLEIAVISYEPHPRDFDAHAFVVAQFCLLWICVSSIELDKIQDFYERLEVMRRTKSSLVTALERGEHIPKHEKLKKASGSWFGSSWAPKKKRSSPLEADRSDSLGSTESNDIYLPLLVCEPSKKSQ